MKRLESRPASIPPHDYRMADPMPRRRDERKEHFIEKRRWRDARHANGRSGSVAR